MNQETISVDNLKCGGCANTISKNLEKIEGLEKVSVDIEASAVTITYVEEETRRIVLYTLNRLGYPEAGTGTNLQKVKSIVSCATGRLNS